MATQRCPCGYFGDPKRPCTCSPNQIQNYRARVSGPLMDRIDLQVEVPAVPFKDLSADTAGPSSAEVRAQVVAARQRQHQRLDGQAHCNAQMTTRQVRDHCRLSSDCSKLLEAAMERFNLSARAYTRILKMARTITDLDGAKDIARPHLAEAIGYRSLDRGMA